MPGDLIGDPLWAVLIPPRLARFRELTGLEDAAITVDVSGWNKYVLLARGQWRDEDVYPFPFAEVTRLRGDRLFQTWPPAPRPPRKRPGGWISPGSW